MERQEIALDRVVGEVTSEAGIHLLRTWARVQAHRQPSQALGVLVRRLDQDLINANMRGLREHKQDRVGHILGGRRRGVASIRPRREAGLDDGDADAARASLAAQCVAQGRDLQGEARGGDALWT